MIRFRNRGKDNVESRIAVSAGAATVAQLWRIGVTFLTHMALRRLIPPEEFGVWVWAEALFIILAQVRDIGLPAHVMRDEERPYGSYLVLEATWGGAFSLLVLLGAPVLSLAYADRSPDVVAMIRALCLFLFVQGLGSVALTYFEAELQVLRAIPAELVRNVFFAVLAIGLAWNGYGAWSMAIAHISAGVVFAAMLWWEAWKTIKLTRSRNGLRQLVRRSVPLAVMALLELTMMRLDAFVLGLQFPTAVVATAGLAVYAVFFFSRFLADPVGRALYPGLVRFRHDPPRAFEAYRLGTLLLCALTVPTSFFLFVNAEYVSLFLGGRNWIGAADYLRVLSFVPLVRPLTMFGPDFLLTRHEDRLVLIYSAVNLFSLGVLGLLLTQTRLGPLGMAVAGYLPVGLGLLTLGIYRIDRVGFRRLSLNLVELYAVGAALFLPQLLISSEGPWWRLGLSCLAGLLFLGYVLWRFGEACYSFLRGQP